MAKEYSGVVLTTPARELVLMRIFDAPREKVFDAFADAKTLAKWWGPTSITNPVCEMDFREGGARRIVMRAPSGEDYPITGVFTEIVPNERIVMVDNVSEHSPDWHAMVNKHRPGAIGNLPELLWSITFEDHGTQTKITIHYHFDAAHDRDALVKIGMVEGWTESLEKLEKLLA